MRQQKKSDMFDLSKNTLWPLESTNHFKALWLDNPLFDKTLEFLLMCLVSLFLLLDVFFLNYCYHFWIIIVPQCGSSHSFMCTTTRPKRRCAIKCVQIEQTGGMENHCHIQFPVTLYLLELVDPKTLWNIKKYLLQVVRDTLTVQTRAGVTDWLTHRRETLSTVTNDHVSTVYVLFWKRKDLNRDSCSIRAPSCKGTLKRFS